MREPRVSVGVECNSVSLSGAPADDLYGSGRFGLVNLPQRTRSGTLKIEGQQFCEPDDQFSGRVCEALYVLSLARTLMDL
jgi:hypothetical protein